MGSPADFRLKSPLVAAVTPLTAANKPDGSEPAIVVVAEDTVSTASEVALPLLLKLNPSPDARFAASLLLTALGSSSTTLVLALVSLTDKLAAVIVPGAV